MSGLINKIKSKATGHKRSSSKGEEPTFSIQPHPAKSNDPADLQPSGPGSGLRNNDAMAAHHAHGPQIPSTQTAAGLEQPLSREELRARQAELNK
ncbi:hypothetical protein K435DRAFT_970834 [Dendrothele bispora CBS 962.96]|uniref:Uncharacterized protein n=1 Tax=Dendrothele bispora (strain CBS 962.96) TaxID=1314807 RepID=A0A4V4HD16_DENBC|nr:hypothetical protein K435DRAFT_970834 [Dendrothele bispora CBS 962.96]